MNIDDIKNELNNPKFKIDIVALLFNIHKINLLNSYHLKSILKRQLVLLELQKGKQGQELESAVERELEALELEFSNWITEDIVDVLRYSSHD